MNPEQCATRKKMLNWQIGKSWRIFFGCLAPESRSTCGNFQWKEEGNCKSCVKASKSPSWGSDSDVDFSATSMDMLSVIVKHVLQNRQYTMLQYLTLPYITQHNITFHTLYTVHWVTLHYNTLHYIIRWIALHYILHWITLHYIINWITLHCITLRYHALPYNTTHHRTLPDMPYITIHYQTLP